jgi:hypothetical protein
MTPRSGLVSIAIQLACAMLIGVPVQIEPSVRDCSPATCEVQIQNRVTLRDQSPPLLPDYSVFVAPLGSNYYITISRSRDRLLVFERDGRLSSTLGAGTFRRLSGLTVGPNGHVFAFDAADDTLSEVGRNLGVLGRVKVENPPDLLMPDGRFIVASQIQTPDLIGFPLHLADATGRVRKSFGADIPEFRSDLRLLGKRIVALSGDGDVWAVPAVRYILERWNPVTGQLRNRFVLDSGWFKEAPADRSDRQKPSTIVEAAWARDGLVWILSRDPDPNARGSLNTGLERPVTADEMDRLFDWVLEAVNPVAGRVVASRRFTNAQWARSGTPFLVSRRSAGPGGLRTFDVWSPSVQRRERGRK